MCKTKNKNKNKNQELTQSVVTNYGTHKLSLTWGPVCQPRECFYFCSIYYIFRNNKVPTHTHPSLSPTHMPVRGRGGVLQVRAHGFYSTLPRIYFLPCKVSYVCTMGLLTMACLLLYQRKSCIQRSLAQGFFLL